MRLRSTLPTMVFLPLSVIGYAWICQTHQPVAAICVMLFIAGFSSMLVSLFLNSLRVAESLSTDRWIYTSTLAYIIDANTGRSSTAVATNSGYRGIIAFIAAEIAIPLQVSSFYCDRIMLAERRTLPQDRIGDGGLYVFWAGLLLIMEMLVLLVLKFGSQWREKCEEAESKNDSE